MECCRTKEEKGCCGDFKKMIQKTDKKDKKINPKSKGFSLRNLFQSKDFLEKKEGK